MAKQSKKKQSASQKAAYAAYSAENRHEKNKIKKLESHVNKHTDENMICKDAQAAEALKRLKSAGAKYIRNNKNKSGIRSHPLVTYKDKHLKKGGTVTITEVKQPSKFMQSLNRTMRASINEAQYNRRKKPTPKFTCWGDELRHIKAKM